MPSDTWIAWDTDCCFFLFQFLLDGEVVTLSWNQVPALTTYVPAGRPARHRGPLPPVNQRRPLNFNLNFTTTLDSIWQPFPQQLETDRLVTAKPVQGNAARARAHASKRTHRTEKYRAKN
jgi:hypothetical protein